MTIKCNAVHLSDSSRFRCSTGSADVPSAAGETPALRSRNVISLTKRNGIAIKRTIILVLVFLLSIGLSACGDSSWETINPKGTKTTFMLPKPVEHPAREGYEMYEARTGNGDNKIQIGIFPRKGNLTEVIPDGTPDADALQLFEKHNLEMLQTNLLKAGLEPRLEFDKDLGVENGLGQQFKYIVGDKFTLNQFYITPEQLLWVKIDNSDESDPVVARFLDSLEP